MIKRIGDIVFLQVSETDSNIYIFGDTAIDSGTGLNFTRMYQFLNLAKVDPKTIKTVVNTHAHYDHVGGNGYFLNAKVAMHEADAAALESADAEICMVDFFDGKLKPRKVDTRLNDGDKLSMGGYEFQVIHTPGHTPGSICLYDAKKRVLVSGDTVFADAVGRVDLPGGDADEMIASLKKLAALKVDKILPGHGDPVESGASALIAKLAKAGPIIPSEDGDEEDINMVGQPV